VGEQVLTVTIENYDQLGRGVGRTPTGEIVIVPGARVGETVRCSVEKKLYVFNRWVYICRKL
jgi:predicted RNA-binding protein with TRAM domain